MFIRGTRFIIWRFCPDDFLSPFLFKNVNFFCSNIFFVQNCCVRSNFYLFENFRSIPKDFLFENLYLIYCPNFFVRTFFCLIFFVWIFFSEELFVQIFISFEFLIQKSFSQNLHFCSFQFLIPSMDWSY